MERYLAAVQSWAPVEAETERAIKRLLASQFVDEAFALHEIAALLPRLGSHLTTAAAFDPQNQRLRSIHEDYLGAWRDLIAGLHDVQTGLTAGDVPQLARGRKGLDGWRDTMVNVASRVIAIRRELGIAQ